MFYFVSFSDTNLRGGCTRLQPDPESLHVHRGGPLRAVDDHAAFHRPVDPHQRHRHQGQDRDVGMRCQKRR